MQATDKEKMNRPGLKLLKNLLDKYPDHIEISNLERVGATLGNIIEDGIKALQVISDFDQTLTKTHHEGKPVDCSWGVLDNSPFVPEAYRSAAKTLRAKYYPIEIDPHLSVEEKVPHMIKWFTEAHDNLVACKFYKKNIGEMVSNSTVQIRDGVDEFFNTLEEQSVPLLIFSAGIGDLIKEILLQQSSIHPNTHIISNFLKYNDEGMVTGFKGDLIHVFNKSENSVKSTPYFDELSNRNNVILLGDTLPDIHMVDGVQYNNLIKIGYLNHQVDKPFLNLFLSFNLQIESRIDTFRSHYDIVLIDDQTMNVALDILRAII